MAAVASRAKADTAAEVRFIKIVVFLNALIPLGYLLWDWNAGNLGANPIDYITRATGTLALLFLVLTLAVTPLRMATGWGFLGKLRRVPYDCLVEYVDRLRREQNHDEPGR